MLLYIVIVLKMFHIKKKILIRVFYPLNYFQLHDDLLYLNCNKNSVCVENFWRNVICTLFGGWICFLENLVWWLMVDNRELWLSELNFLTYLDLLFQVPNIFGLVFFTFFDLESGMCSTKQASSKSIGFSNSIKRRSQPQIPAGLLRLMNSSFKQLCLRKTVLVPLFKSGFA